MMKALVVWSSDVIINDCYVGLLYSCAIRCTPPICILRLCA